MIIVYIRPNRLSGIWIEHSYSHRSPREFKWVLKKILTKLREDSIEPQKRLSGKANRLDEHFYDLPFIQLITKALLKLTSDTGQPTHIEIISNWFHLIPELRSIIKSFNNGSGESSQSYMGKSVITNCILSILNIIRQVKHEKWESTLLDENSSLLWCPPHSSISSSWHVTYIFHTSKLL